MFDANEIKRLIGASLPCDFVAIEGDDGVHFTGIVVSAAFEGKPMVRQHQAVYASLGALMGNEIHALQLQTYTPAKWETVRGELGL
ncbi:BolA/IbaG family iron-sulfur metabolism protein [Azoarcus sp. TTM-91]|uniref:BolA protein family transcriptional regulator n=1 Tax=Azoarcus indigens TaxID=29545 RepID=A0A4R6E857_9RHOO|nr:MULTISPECIES: BolA/IbaG family iron-sulfur metabolism protein [Azoarcus]NMG35293.1 BolA/IbaG family iron-sulfur metabolism protein [Azoarcus sp. TTM-91]NMG63980.1 BolA/IbaG family iron-sulfur metabolism protein [Azoarcus indigens]TDN53744.1 BolA protein family transcriptional regulator [Azoarcus indigens]